VAAFNLNYSSSLLEIKPIVNAEATPIITISIEIKSKI
jgi:hypothetical protein